MYENGVVAAFLLWCVAQVRLVIALNSQLERNLRKVRMRHSWTTLTAKPSEPGEWPTSFAGKALKYTLLSVVGLVGTLFSWLWVATYIGSVIYAKSKDAGAPAEVREFRWRMRNQEMTREQMAELMAKAAFSDEADRAKAKAQFMEETSR